MTSKIFLFAIVFICIFTNEIQSADLTIKISTKGEQQENFIDITPQNYIIQHPVSYNATYIVYDIKVDLFNYHPSKIAIAQARYSVGQMPDSVISWWGWPFKSNGYSERKEFISSGSPEEMTFRYYLRYNDLTPHADTLLFDVDIWFKNEEQTTLVNRKVKYIIETRVPYSYWVPLLTIQDVPTFSVPVKEHGYKYTNNISINKGPQETIWYFDTLNGMPTEFSVFTNQSSLINNHTYGFILKRVIQESGYNINFFSDIGYIYWDNSEPEVSDFEHIETESTVPFAKIHWFGGKDNTYIKQYVVYRHDEGNDLNNYIPIDTIVTGVTDTLDHNPRYVEDITLLQEHIYTYLVEAEDAAGNKGSIRTAEPIFLTPEPDVTTWYTRTFPDTATYFTNTLKTSVTIPEETFDNGRYVVNYQASKYLPDFIPGAQPSATFYESDWTSNAACSIDHPSEGKWYYRVQLKYVDDEFYSRYCELYNSIVDTTSPSIISHDNIDVAVFRGVIDTDSLVVNITWEAAFDKSGILDYHIYRKKTEDGDFEELVPSSMINNNGFYDYFDNEALNETFLYAIIPEDSAGNSLKLSPTLAKTVSPRYSPIITWANQDHNLIFFDINSFDTSSVSGYLLQTTVYGNQNNVILKTVEAAKIIGEYLVKTVPPMSGRMGLRLGVTYSQPECEGIVYYSNELYVHSIIVEELQEDDVIGFMVQPNYPNPFNSTTTIRYFLPFVADLECNILNIQGRVIKTYTLDNCPVGQGSVEWNATDARGNEVSSGIYFFLVYCKPQNQEQITILRKLTYIK